MARDLDAMAVIFPFEPDCYADTKLPVEFVGHPFLAPDYTAPVRYDSAGPVLLLPGSRTQAVTKIFPLLLAGFEEFRKTSPAARAVVRYPSEEVAAAQEKHWTGPVLNRVFQKTFQAAKHIRSSTAIGQGQISVASVAVDLAGKIFGDLAPTCVLVVGAGDIGLKTVQAFQSRGAKSIIVASRTLAKAEEAAAAAGGWAASMAELPEVLATSDIVASSTSAPGLIITRELAAAAMKRRPGRPLFLIDLALPRDIEPAAATLPNVYLYNLDDLARIAESNLAHRQAEVAKCRAILTERTAALWPQISRYLEPGANGTTPLPGS
jgi:glutamyl-tRNA reductase